MDVLQELRPTKPDGPTSLTKVCRLWLWGQYGLQQLSRAEAHGFAPCIGHPADPTAHACSWKVQGSFCSWLRCIVAHLPENLLLWPFVLRSCCRLQRMRRLRHMVAARDHPAGQEAGCQPGGFNTRLLKVEWHQGPGEQQLGAP